MQSNAESVKKYGSHTVSHISPKFWLCVPYFAFQDDSFDYVS